MRRRTVLRTGLGLSTAAFAGCNSLVGDDETGTQVPWTPTDRQTNRLEIPTKLGLVTRTDPYEIGAVALTVRPRLDAPPVDLTAVEIQWVDATDTYNLVHEQVYAGAADSAFAHGPSQSSTATPTDSDPAVLDGTDDTATLYVDVGNSESADGAGNDVASAYDTTLEDDEVIRERGLSEGEEATLQLTTGRSVTTVLQLTVPETCSCVPPIEL